MRLHQPGSQSDRSQPLPQVAVPPGDWDTIAASLAELGLQPAVERAPPPAVVVLAAQLKLRYWRRQLPCGQFHEDFCPEPSDGCPLAASEPRVLAAPAAATAGEGRPSLATADIRERITSIKIARDRLLAYSCRGLVDAAAGD